MAKKPKTAEEQKKKEAYYSKTEKKAKAVKKQSANSKTLASNADRGWRRSFLFLLFLVVAQFQKRSHLGYKANESSETRPWLPIRQCGNQRSLFGWQILAYLQRLEDQRLGLKRASESPCQNKLP